jgi:hypothetical protein
MPPTRAVLQAPKGYVFQLARQARKNVGVRFYRIVGPAQERVPVCTVPIGSFQQTQRRLDKGKGAPLHSNLIDESDAVEVLQRLDERVRADVFVYMEVERRSLALKRGHDPSEHPRLAVRQDQIGHFHRANPSCPLT